MGSEVLRAEVLSYFELICLLKPFHKKLVSDTDLWFRSSVGPAEGSFLEGGCVPQAGPCPGSHCGATQSLFSWKGME